MQNIVLKHMLTGGVYYTWYRFSSKSNYIAFEEWCVEYVQNLTERQLQLFIAVNNLEAK